MTLAVGGGWELSGGGAASGSVMLVSAAAGGGGSPVDGCGGRVSPGGALGGASGAGALSLSIVSSSIYCICSFDSVTLLTYIKLS